MLERAAEAHASWSERSASELRMLLRRLLRRIEVHANQLTLHVETSRLAAFLQGILDRPTSSDADAISLTTPVTLTRSKHEMRLIIKGQAQA